MPDRTHARLIKITHTGHLLKRPILTPTPSPDLGGVGTYKGGGGSGVTVASRWRHPADRPIVSPDETPRDGRSHGRDLARGIVDRVASAGLMLASGGVTPAARGIVDRVASPWRHRGVSSGSGVGGVGWRHRGVTRPDPGLWRRWRHRGVSVASPGRSADREPRRDGRSRPPAGSLVDEPANRLNGRLGCVSPTIPLFRVFSIFPTLPGCGGGLKF